MPPAIAPDVLGQLKDIEKELSEGSVEVEETTLDPDIFEELQSIQSELQQGAPAEPGVTQTPQTTTAPPAPVQDRTQGFQGRGPVPVLPPADVAGEVEMRQRVREPIRKGIPLLDKPAPAAGSSLVKPFQELPGEPTRKTVETRLNRLQSDQEKLRTRSRELEEEGKLYRDGKLPQERVAPFEAELRELNAAQAIFERNAEIHKANVESFNTRQTVGVGKPSREVQVQLSSAERGMREAIKLRDSLPAFARAPGYIPAEVGPIRNKTLEINQKMATFGGEYPVLRQQLAREYQRVLGEKGKIEELQSRNARGMLTKKQAKELGTRTTKFNERLRNLELKNAGLVQNYKVYLDWMGSQAQFNGITPARKASKAERVGNQVQNVPWHGGLKIGGEDDVPASTLREFVGLTLRGENISRDAVRWVRRNFADDEAWDRGKDKVKDFLFEAVFPLRSSANQAYEAMRTAYMNEGHYPPLEQSPYKGKAGVRQAVKEKNEIIALVGAYGSKLQDDGTVVGFTTKRGQKRKPFKVTGSSGELTAYQMRLIPQVKRAIKVENELRELANLDGTLALDLATMVASGGAAGTALKILGRPAAKAALRKLAPSIYGFFARHAASVGARAGLPELTGAALKSLAIGSAPKVAVAGFAGGTENVINELLLNLAAQLDSETGGTLAPRVEGEGDLQLQLTTSAVVGGLLGAALPGAGAAIRGGRILFGGSKPRPRAGLTPRVPSQSVFASDANARIDIMDGFEKAELAGTATPEQGVLTQIVETMNTRQDAEAAMFEGARIPDADVYIKDWNQSAFSRHHDQLARAAETAEDPTVADILQGAANSIRNTFNYGHVARTLDEGTALPSAVEPGQASAYRMLTEDEFNALPKDAQTALLLDDIMNSERVLNPDSINTFSGEVPSAKDRGGNTLVTHADTKFREAMDKVSEWQMPTAEDLTGVRLDDTPTVTDVTPDVTPAPVKKTVKPKKKPKPAPAIGKKGAAERVKIAKEIAAVKVGKEGAAKLRQQFKGPDKRIDPERANVSRGGFVSEVMLKRDASFEAERANVIEAGGKFDDAAANRARNRVDREFLVDVDSRVPLLKDTTFKPTLSRAIEHTKATGEPAAMASLDIRNLGGLNDPKIGLGEAGADKMLARVADTVKKFITKKGVHISFYRTGGDEWTAVAVGVTKPELHAAFANAKRAIDLLVENTEIHGKPLSQMPHPKGKAPGFGFLFDTVEITGKSKTDDLFNDVLERVKKVNDGVEGDAKSSDFKEANDQVPGGIAPTSDPAAFPLAKLDVEGSAVPRPLTADQHAAGIMTTAEVGKKGGQASSKTPPPPGPDLPVIGPMTANAARKGVAIRNKRTGLSHRIVGITKRKRPDNRLSIVVHAKIIKPSPMEPGMDIGTVQDIALSEIVTDFERLGSPRTALGPATAFTGPRRVGDTGNAIFDNWVSENIEHVPNRDGVKTFRDRLKDMREGISGFLTSLAKDDPRFGALERAFSNVRAGRELGNTRALIRLQEVIDGLKGDELRAFTNVLLLRDMLEDVQFQKVKHLENGGQPKDFRHVLPIDTTVDQLKADLATVMQDVKAAPKIREALTKRNDLVKAVKNEFLDLMEAVTGRTPDLSRQHYFRHMMQGYRAGQQFGRAKNIVGSVDAQSFLKEREGSLRSYTTDYRLAEMDWLPSMITSIERLKLAKMLQDDFDISPQLQVRAAELNDANFAGNIAGLVNNFTDVRALTEKRKRRGDAVKMLANMASGGLLPDTANGRFRDLIEELQSFNQVLNERNKNGHIRFPGTPSGIGKQLPEYARWVQSVQAKAGKTDAKLKRRAGITARDLVDESRFAEYDLGGSAFIQDSLSWPEDLRAAISKEVLEKAGLSEPLINRVEATRVRQRFLVIPKELVPNLNRLFERQPEPTVFQSAKRQVIRGVKMATLFHPDNWFNYGLGNFVGDWSAIMRGNPDAILEVKATFKDLRDWYIRGKPPSAELKAFLDEGAAQQLLTTAEDIGSTSATDPFGKFTGRKGPIIQKAFRAAGAGIVLPHDFRELFGRYAAFRSFKKQILKNGRPVTYGASNPAEIRGLLEVSPDAAAARLSKDLVIDYDRTSSLGLLIARNTGLFWRYHEGNIRREKGLLLNSVYTPRVAAQIGRDLIGAEKPFVTAMMVGRYFVMANMWHAYSRSLMHLLNKDIEEQLTERQRGRPHFAMRIPGTSQIAYWSRPDSYTDFLSWMGLDNAWGMAEAIRNGRMTSREVAQEMGAAFIKKSGNVLVGPHIGIIGTAAFGVDLFDPLDPKVIPKGKRWEEVMKDLRLDKAFKWKQNLPKKPNYGDWWKTVTGAGWYDLQRSAYDDIRQFKYNWMKREKGKDAGGVPNSDPLSSAVNYYLEAVRFGDNKARAHALLQIGELGGTQDMIRQKAKRLNPLSGLGEADKKKFIQGLSKHDQEKVKRAFIHWGQLVAPDMDPTDVDESDPYIYSIIYEEMVEAFVEGMFYADDGSLTEKQIENLKSKLMDNFIKRELRKAGVEEEE